ncbi:MAG TPA: DUF1566 domain-containing protein, partial [bacterium]|nr:DUF1566 domain-containing protein [bacterium]
VDGTNYQFDVVPDNVIDEKDLAELIRQWPSRGDDPPVVLSSPVEVALVGAPFSYQIAVSDPQGTGAIFRLIEAPQGVTLNADTGLVEWTPNAEQRGRHRISVGITNASGRQTTHYWDVTVGAATVEASGVVNPTQGGVVVVDNPESPLLGARIVIPGGSQSSLSGVQTADIEIRFIDDEAHFFPDAKPVEIIGLPQMDDAVGLEIPYDASLLSATTVSEQDLDIYHFNPETQEWEPLQRGQIEGAGINIVAKQAGLSTIAAILIPGYSGAKTVVVATKYLVRLNLQPRKVTLVKGTVDQFCSPSSRARRIIFIHGIASFPGAFMQRVDGRDNPYDFLSSSNVVRNELFSKYDCIATYQYPSGRRIDTNAAVLVEKLKKEYEARRTASDPSMKNNSTFQMDIVAHSMGGLVARWAIEQEGLSHNVRSLVTLGTPHRGFDWLDGLTPFLNLLLDYCGIDLFGIGLVDLKDLLRFSFPGVGQAVKDLDIGGTVFLDTLNELNPPTTVSSAIVNYYGVAGKKGTIPYDPYISISSATYLNLQPGRERIFGDNESQGSDGKNYEHGKLHERAGDPGISAANRTGDQVLAWLAQASLPPPTPASGRWFDGIIGTIATGVTRSDATGDDGHYRKGKPRSFRDNGNGTVTDNNTGLIWVKDPSAAGVGGTYTWSDAITACENLVYAGYSDWRLPTVQELSTLVDAGRFNPAIDPVFVCRDFWYCSS